MADFKKLGLGRVAMDVAKAVGSPTANIQTGNITNGEIVVVEIESGGGTAITRERRSLAHREGCSFHDHRHSRLGP